MPRYALKGKTGTEGDHFPVPARLPDLTFRLGQGVNDSPLPGPSRCATEARLSTTPRSTRKRMLAAAIGG